ncbi:MAG: hypothetical protein ACRENO_01225 [Thermodesulfobacteriota bacterium]
MKLIIDISLNILISIIFSTAVAVGSFFLYLHSTFIVKEDLERLGDRIILETRTELLLSRDILIRNLQRELLDTEFMIQETPSEYLYGKKREIEILLKKIESEIK